MPLLALIALLAVAVPLAMPGLAFVPGARPGNPDWLLGPTGEGFDLTGEAYLWLLIAATLLWLVVVAGAPRIGAPRLIAAGLALIGLFAIAPPLHSLDVFSYISYARLGVEHGLNPYDNPPAAVPMDPAALRVQDFRDAVSVYGPVFTLISYPLGLVGVAVALWSFKALAALSVVGLTWLVARLAARRGIDPLRAAAFVSLNPLVLVHIVGGAHNDGLMILTAMAAVGLLSEGAVRSGAVALIVAVAIKVSAALVAPFALLGSRDRGSLLKALIVGGAAVAAGSLLIFGSGVAEAVGVAGGNQDTISRYSVPATISRGLDLDPDLLRMLFAGAYALAVAWLALWVTRGGDWIRAAGWAAVGLLIASAYMAPWYIVWALPLVAIGRDRVLVAVAIALTALQLPNALPL